MAGYCAVSPAHLRDILILDAWGLGKGRAAGPSGKSIMLEKPGFDTPIQFPFFPLIAEKRVRAICKYAQISPERFETLRVRVQAPAAPVASPVSRPSRT